MRSKCINIHDPQSRIYELAKEYDGRRTVPKNFFMLLESYQNHPEAKSLGPDGLQNPTVFCESSGRNTPRDHGKPLPIREWQQRYERYLDLTAERKCCAGR